MAIVNTNGLPTLLDQVKRMDPNGSIATIVELLTQRNPILQHVVWQEGNLTAGHRYTSRTGLPTIAWRRLNEGVTPGKSAVSQIDESCGMMSGMSAIDVEVAKLNGNEAAFRASEDAAFLQSFNNEFARALIYESTKTNPERMHGIQPRLDSLTGAYSSQVISAGGTGTSHLTSMYFVCWSPDCCFCIYPKGSTGGLEQQDMGIQLWGDGQGGTPEAKFRAYVTQWTWKCGLVIKDFRQVGRICNINTNTLAKSGGGAGSGYLIDHMLKLHYQIDNPSGGNAAWYCNRSVAHWLHAQALASVANSTLSIDMIDGKPITRFLGVPIHILDCIKGYNGGTVAAGTAESQVS